MPFRIIRNDITKVRADVIVNSANPAPVYAAGTDRAVYKAAGAEELLAERKKIGPIHPGEVAVTPAFRLPALYIIHTVGPQWIDGSHGELDTLSSCYRKSLLIARQLGCKSIAFPLISTGVYGFPKDEALRIALDSIREFLDENEMDVMLVVFDKKAFALSSSLVNSVEQFIDEKYVEDKSKAYYGRDGRRRERERRFNDELEYDAFDFDDECANDLSEYESPEEIPEWQPRPRASNSVSGQSGRKTGDHLQGVPVRLPDEKKKKKGLFGRIASKKSDDSRKGVYAAPSAPHNVFASPYLSSASAIEGRSLQDLISNVGETFQQCLLRMIDERKLTDTEVYKKANIDRKLFSKIRCNTYYNPTKKTALALAIALQLNLEETADLLGRAGLALSPSSKMDLIVEFCIVNRIYDLYQVNAMLFNYNQQTLG